MYVNTYILYMYLAYIFNRICYGNIKYDTCLTTPIAAIQTRLTFPVDGTDNISMWNKGIFSGVFMLENTWSAPLEHFDSKASIH